MGEVHPGTALVTGKSRAPTASLHSTWSAGFRCHRNPVGSASRITQTLVLPQPRLTVTLADLTCLGPICFSHKMRPLRLALQRGLRNAILKPQVWAGECQAIEDGSF